MPKYQQKRNIKTLLIDPQMQKEYTFLMVVVLFVAAIVISILVNWTIRDTMLSGPYRMGKVSPYEVMSTINYLITVRITIAFIVTIVATSFLSIKFLHRVGGPIYRFRVAFKELAKGSIPRDISLRSNDFYKNVAAEINVVLAILRNDEQKKNEIASELEKLPKEQLPPEWNDKIQNMIKELKSP